MKDNTDIKRRSPRPADPVIVVAPAPVTTGDAAAEQAQLKLQAFADGFIFKFAPHPKEANTFVLFDTDKNVVAVLKSAPIADLICTAVRMLFEAVAESKAREATRPGTPDNLVAAASTPEMRAS